MKQRLKQGTKNAAMVFIWLLGIAAFIGVMGSIKH